MNQRKCLGLALFGMAISFGADAPKSEAKPEANYKIQFELRTLETARAEMKLQVQQISAQLESISTQIEAKKKELCPGAHVAEVDPKSMYSEYHCVAPPAKK